MPEATSVDEETRNLLAKSNEDDFYLSNISPLGVPFNTVKGMSNDFWKDKRINANKAGSSCPKKFLALNKEYDPQGMCTASKKYQDIKLAALDKEKNDLPEAIIAQQKATIYEKACLCVGLANASYLENGMEIKGQQQGVVICPGPNLAYFNKITSLSDMVQHIYGKINLLTVTNRPHVFIKELQMYVNHLQKAVTDCSGVMTALQQKKWTAFKSNLQSGIDYYQDLFQQSTFFIDEKKQLQQQLNDYRLQVAGIEI